MALAPRSLTIRSYGVGFGDCFLLTFHYAGAVGDRHMLIDFGSTQRPPNRNERLLVTIARDLAKTVGTRLHVLVATHRHADHISGFTTEKGGKGPGDIIAALEPALVVQPWTETPDAQGDWTGAAFPRAQAARDREFRTALHEMQAVASAIGDEAVYTPGRLRRQLQFIALDGVSNRAAVENLARMAGKGHAAYVKHGSKLPTADLLPGVQIKVLGPPTLRQKAGIATQRETRPDEFWHFAAFWRLAAQSSKVLGNGGGDPLFPRARVYRRGDVPAQNRWFVNQIRKARTGQLLRIVRAMDGALNNTSVILLIKAGKKTLLFPGDAQWESWEYALAKHARELRGVDVYKVGHHGSLNATPRTLWDGFTHRATDATATRRLITLLSTRTDSKHGSRERGTEVPRETLVRALKQWSRLVTTQELENGTGNVVTTEIDLTK
jgi:hypothetical protein